MLLNNQCVNEEIKGEMKKCLETNETYNTPKSLECSKNSSKKECHSNTGLPQETRKISNKQTKFTPKKTRKRRKEFQKLMEVLLKEWQREKLCRHAPSETE